MRPPLEYTTPIESSEPLEVSRRPGELWTMLLAISMLIVLLALTPLAWAGYRQVAWLEARVNTLQDEVQSLTLTRCGACRPCHPPRSRI